MVRRNDENKSSGTGTENNESRDGLGIGISGDNIASEFIDPESSASAGTQPGSEPRKRGRKPGQKNGTSKKEEKTSLEAFASLLYVCHASLAAGLTCPELVLSNEECERLSIALNSVSRHYNIGLSDKQKDFFSLAIAAGSIYGGRIIAIRNRKQDEKRERQKQFQTP